MKNENVKLSNKDCEFFGSFILMFIFAPLFWNKQDFPEELKIEIDKLMCKEDITKEDLNVPLLTKYYDYLKCL